jgi:hypothetical protein
MKLRFLAGASAVSTVLAFALASSCGGGLPDGEFSLDAAALDLPNCADGSPPIEIQSFNCPGATCPTEVAYAICTGTTYGVCSCTGKAPGTDAGMRDEAIMTGTEGSVPEATSSETGPSDAGSKDTGPKDTGPKDTGPKDTGPKDTGPKDTAPPDTGPADAGTPG